MGQRSVSLLTCVVGVVVVALAGCGLVSIDPTPEELDPGALTTECEPPFAFQGDGTIAELGLLGDLPNLGDHAVLHGAIRITRDSVRHEDFLPPGVPPTVDEGQLLCITFADGSGMALMLPVPFPSERAAGDSGGDGIDWTPVLVGLVVAAVVGVSWAAYRHPSG